MSVIHDFLKKTAGDKQAEPRAPRPPEMFEAPKRLPWSAWAGWGVAVVAVVSAAPVVMERWMGVDKGAPASLAVNASLGVIQAVSEPPGAGILMDGRFVGVTPARFQWTAGQATMTLKKNGFQDLTAAVRVDATKEVDFRVSLSPAALPSAKSEPIPVEKPGAMASVEPPPAPESPAPAPVAAVPVVLESVPAHDGSAPVFAPGESASLMAIPEPTAGHPLTLAPPPQTASEEGAAPSGETSAATPTEEKSAAAEPAPAKDKPASRKKEKPHKAPAPAQDGVVTPAMTAAALDDAKKIAVEEAMATLLKSSDTPPLQTLDFAYSIQMAAFLDRESALREAALWRKKGYDAYVLELWGVKDPTRLWQSVRVGRFNDLAKAWAALDALRKKEGIKGFYVARSDTFAPPSGAPPSQSSKIIPLSASAKAAETPVAAPSAPATAHEPEKESAPAPVHETTTSAVPQPEKPPIAPPADAKPEPAPAPANVDWKKSSDDAVKTVAPAPAIAPEPPPVVAGEPAAKPVAVEEKPAVEKAKRPQQAKAAKSKTKEPEAVTEPSPISWGNATAPVEPEAPKPAPQPEVAKAPAPAPQPEVAKAAPPPPVEPMTEAPREMAKAPAPVAQPRAPEPMKPQARPARPMPAPVADAQKPSAQQVSQAEKLYLQSVEKKNGNDMAGEEALLQQVVQLDPANMQAVRRLARILVETNRADQSLELLRHAAGGRSDTFLAEEDPNLAAFMAALYQRREDHWQAIDLYDALLKKYPNKGIWQMGMAISLEKVSENGEALRAYKKALESGDLNHKLQNFVRKRIEKL
ncbi:MAG: PEGA domain-containing protein [Magnetococcales bacterium]|nr:PEGA domain-containing protein [Magnetococcales bacterium]